MPTTRKTPAEKALAKRRRAAARRCDAVLPPRGEGLARDCRSRATWIIRTWDSDLPPMHLCGRCKRKWLEDTVVRAPL